MRPILTTLHFPSRPAWAARARMLDRSAMSPPRLLRELLQRARPEDVVVLDGGIGLRDAYLDRVAAALLSRRRHRPTVLVTDSTWTPGRGRRAATRVLGGPGTAYCVHSSDERESFPINWGVDPARVFVTPFYWTIPEDEPQADFDGAGVFAGGDSLRTTTRSSPRPPRWTSRSPSRRAGHGRASCRRTSHGGRCPPMSSWRRCVPAPSPSSHCGPDWSAAPGSRRT